MRRTPDVLLHAGLVIRVSLVPLVLEDPDPTDCPTNTCADCIFRKYEAGITLTGCLLLPLLVAWGVVDERTSRPGYRAAQAAAVKRAVAVAPAHPPKPDCACDPFGTVCLMAKCGRRR